MARSPSVRVVDRRLQPGEVWASKAGTGLGASVGTHFTLLWVLAGFVVITAIVCMYAGEQRHLAERQFGDVRVHDDLQVDGTILGRKNVIILRAARDLKESESGSVIVFGDDSGAGNVTGGFNVNLPAPKRGLNFRFVVKGAAVVTSGITVKTTSDGTTAANLAVGSITNNNATTNVTALTDVTTFGTAATGGDYAEFWCDGTNWEMVGFGAAATAVTLA